MFPRWLGLIAVVDVSEQRVMALRSVFDRAVAFEVWAASGVARPVLREDLIDVLDGSKGAESNRPMESPNQQPGGFPAGAADLKLHYGVSYTTAYNQIPNQHSKIVPITNPYCGLRNVTLVGENVTAKGHGSLRRVPKWRKKLHLSETMTTLSSIWRR